MRAARILVGDAIDVLRALPDASVQCCVTSPPYWGLRDYGHAGQLGLEPTPDEYVANMVAVFREVRRVLRDDGTLWLNLGDSYAHGGCGERDASMWPKQSRNDHMPRHAKRPRRADTVGDVDGKHPTRGAGITPQARLAGPGLKPKDLVGIPWRVAFALQAAGWWLRSDIIWSKPNPMPESVTDRPTKAHEYVFLLAKSERYFYDADAVAEPACSGASQRTTDHYDTTDRYGAGNGGNGGMDQLAARMRSGIHTTRNRRSVWHIATQPYSGAHFAVMPEALVEPCVLAGSREGDTVLDPFAGSGTVGVVALRRGRSFVGVELNPAYAKMARERIRDDAPLLNAVEAA